MSFCPILVFAKAPVAGYAKTRLIPALGPEGAAQLADRLLHHAVAEASRTDVGPVELCCAPDTDHAAFADVARRHDVLLSPQGDGDLGERMVRALRRTLNAYGRALLIGTDAPALNAAVLRQAAAALPAHDAVFVPAHDGGYALVGLTRFEPELFRAMTWSTPHVMAHTRERLLLRGLRHLELPTLHDIDEPADLQHLPAGWLP